jgi:hypothetical protein
MSTWLKHVSRCEDVHPHSLKKPDVMPCQVDDPPPETVRLLGLIAQANGEETVATGEACSILFLGRGLG